MNDKEKIDILWEVNVLRREAIENHAREMEKEGIRTYYFDRDLHSIVGIIERPKVLRDP